MLHVPKNSPLRVQLTQDCACGLCNVMDVQDMYLLVWAVCLRSFTDTREDRFVVDGTVFIFIPYLQKNSCTVGYNPILTNNNFELCSITFMPAYRWIPVARYLPTSVHVIERCDSRLRARGAFRGCHVRCTPVYPRRRTRRDIRDFMHRITFL